MISKCIKGLFILFFLISCSERDIEEPLITPNPLGNYNLRIGADKTEGNIFENFQFSLAVNTDEPDITTYLKKHFDSIVFKISDTEGTKLVFKKIDENNSSTLLSWGHNFYLPGNYTLKFQGYKNGQMLFEDTKAVSITNNKDFLSLNWSGFTPSPNAMAYTNVLNTNTLAIYSAYENGDPFAILVNSWEKIPLTDANLNMIAEKDKNYFYSYVSALYGAPQYSAATSPNITDLYNLHFERNLKNDQPVYIWITAKNKLALMKEYSVTNPSIFLGYYIAAEPAS